jgi:hypothetical protein
MIDFSRVTIYLNATVKRIKLKPKMKPNTGMAEPSVTAKKSMLQDAAPSTTRRQRGSRMLQGNPIA